ncbi:hypothetical protein VTL71DRAFT_6340 [Oculimacula yallundae]|uniref:DUF4185 domain-containing protein n=1 Tax=Oculimacula yallundae TaxID=86028 RepID=A0ABR4BYE0_9HELO
MKLLFILMASAALATPAMRRRYDLDNNGIQDLCFDDDNGIAYCYEANGKITTFKGTVGPKQTSTTPKATSAKPVSTSLKAISTPKVTSSSKVVSSSQKATLSAIVVTTKPTSKATTSSKPTSSSKATSSSSSSRTSSSITSSKSASPTGTLPSPSDFASQNNTKWSISTIGSIFSTSMPDLGWDKGRTSVLSGTTFWNFGDVVDVGGGLKDGFAMGAAFYAGKGNILAVDTKDIKNVNDWDFAKAWSGDEKPPSDTPFFGMDTSNVAEVSPGVGVGFVWEIWRNTQGKEVDRGAGIIRVTLGDKVPIANRTGPLITGPDGIMMGITSVLAAEGYIYTYTNGGPNGLIVGRAPLSSAFDATAYEFRKTTGAWVPGIPTKSDMSYGVDGDVHSDGQGSVFFNNYLKKYMFFVGAYGYYMNFYTSATPYGPWSAEYTVASEVGYGINVHPEFSPNGDHSTLYVSSGAADGVIRMRKLVFKY